MWGFPNIKKAHEVDVVTVEVSKHFEWGLQGFNYDWLRLQDVQAF